MLTKSDLQQIDNLIKERLGVNLKPIDKTLRRIQKDMKAILSYFDRAYLNHEKRIGRVENHLDLPEIGTN